MYHYLTKRERVQQIIDAMNTFHLPKPKTTPHDAIVRPSFLSAYFSLFPIPSASTPKLYTRLAITIIAADIVTGTRC